MTLGICCDHAGFDYKQRLIAYLEEKKYQIKDFGTYSSESMDYPDVAHPLAEAVEMCGTGNGMVMTLNKHQGIRAGLAWNEEIGKLVKQHNDANVLVLPARFIPFDMVCRITDVWLDSEFEGGRHQRRIDKIPIK